MGSTKKKIKFSILNDPSWIVFRRETIAIEFSGRTLNIVLRDLVYVVSLHENTPAVACFYVRKWTVCLVFACLNATHKISGNAFE